MPIAVAYRDGGGDHPALSSVLEYMLLRCLHACEAWDGRGVPDGVVDSEITVKGSTIELRGQMASFKGKGNCIEPLEVIVTLDDEGTRIDSLVLRYGDADRGIWAVPFSARGIDPRSVETWLYEFRKER